MQSSDKKCRPLGFHFLLPQYYCNLVASEIFRKQGISFMNEQIYWRVTILFIGWFFGNFMTAQLVAGKTAGKSASQIGTTGNPGMANIMAHLGFKAGITVLLGDVIKTIIAAAIAIALVKTGVTDLPLRLAILYAVTGATLGHNFPLLFGITSNLGKLKAKKDRSLYLGGKGVACTCIGLFLTSPVWGLLSCIAGMLVVFATRYLCIGGVVIPAFFCIPALYFWGLEYGIIAVFLTIMMFCRHFSVIRQIPSGKAEKTDVLGAIRKKLGKKN